MGTERRDAGGIVSCNTLTLLAQGVAELRMRTRKIPKPWSTVFFQGEYWRNFSLPNHQLL